METKAQDQSHNNRLLRLFVSSLYISAFTFGGGYVIVSLMKKKYVDELHWLDEDVMLDLTAIAQSAPGAVAVNNVETYIACALAGLGLIQVPAYDVQDHLRSGELVELLQPWPAPTMPVNLVYPHRRHLSRRVQAFATWLADVLAPHLR